MLSAYKANSSASSTEIMETPRESIFKVGRAILQISGVDPLRHERNISPNGKVMMCVLVVVAVLSVKLYVRVSENLDLLVDCMVSFTINYQVIAGKQNRNCTRTLQFASKTFLILYFKTDIADLMREFATFWELDTADDPKPAEAELRLYKNAVITFFVLAVAHVFVLIFAPLIVGGRNLAFALWLPEGAPSPYYELVYLMEAYEVVMLLSLVVGCDAVFVAFAGNLAVQFKLLSQKMRSATDGETLVECVKHHRRLVESFGKLEGIFQFTFLSQYVLVIATICMNLYVLSIRWAFSGVFALAQLLLSATTYWKRSRESSTC